MDFRLRFLREIRRIVAGETFTTYPFALVHALADLSLRTGPDSGEAFQVPVRGISERLVELYWPQVAPRPGAVEGEVLVQNAGAGGGGRRRAAVVRKVMEARREHGEGIEELRGSGAVWDRLVSGVQTTLRGGPLLELQSAGRGDEVLLYPDRVEGRGRAAHVTLEPGVAFCFREFHPQVTALARSAWVRFVREANPEVSAGPGELRTFLFGPEDPAEAESIRTPEPPDGLGAERWIREFTGPRRLELEAAVKAASGGRILAPIRWVSPLEEDDYARYGGEALLRRLGLTLPERSLHTFWPKGGPRWDALGVDGSGAVLLIEAMANVPELLAAPARPDPSSRVRIGAALEEVKEHLGVSSAFDWSTTFSHYTSRLAHLHLFHELNGVDAWLVFACFVGSDEAAGPSTRDEWHEALRTMYRALGLTPLKLPERTIDVFLDVRTEPGE
jgi:hypothetical protein